MISTKKEYFFSLLTSFFLIALFTGCANYGMISENDVYLQKPTALSTVEDETDLTSYNAFKARERGEYKEAYLIDQMYSRTLISSALYGVRPMFGSPFSTGNFITWGYRSPILAYQNNFYYNSYNHWNNPWSYGNTFGFTDGFRPCGQGDFGYGYGYNSMYHNCNGFGHGIASSQPDFNQNNNTTNSNNQFTARPRISLSSNSARSSTYPSSLKSQELQPGSEVYVNNEKLGTSRRAIQKKRVQGAHMPFISGSNASISSFQRKDMNSSQQQRRVNTQLTSRTNYIPSNSARRNGIARSPRATVNTTTRTGYSSNQYRRVSPQSSGTSRGTGFNTSRTTSPSMTRSTRGGSSTSKGGSSSSSSSSRRR